MKRSIIFVMLMLIGAFGFGQDKIVIESKLEPLMLKFVNDGIERGYNPMPKILKNIDSVLIDPKLQYPILGYYNPKNKSIHIASFTLIDFLILRTTLYHVLTHGITLNNGHVCYKCGDIMSASSPQTFAIYAIKERWDLEVDKLFTLIKEEEKKKIK